MRSDEPEPLESEDPWLKRLVFLYFFMLIFEGALRKWIFPSLAGPLLVIRDPVLLAIYAMAIRLRIFPWNGWVAATIGLAIAGMLASVAVGCPLAITLFGVRTDFWQIPFIFMLPAILDREDIRRIFRWMLILMPLMAVIALLQFRAGPAHWLNATTGGGPDQQLYAAAGRVRPSGTFSFVTGMVSFLALESAFVFQGFFEETPGWPLWIAVPAMLLALGLSGSRSAIIEVGMVAAVAGLTCLDDASRLRKAAVPLAAAALAYGMLHGLGDFREGLDVNRERFDNAGGFQEGIVNRWLGDFQAAWDVEHTAPWLGQGLGMGTSVGAGLATGTRQFLLAEGEWARVVLESGPVLGAAFILLRMGIAGYLLLRALRALRQRGDSLPLLLFAAGIMDLATGQWGQATVSGFAVFTAGLSLAAASALPEDMTEPEPEIAGPRVYRGRGIHAAAIKGGRP
jgi:hypothetical protein